MNAIFIARREGDIRLLFRYCHRNGIVKNQDMAGINDFRLPAIYSETPKPVMPEEAEMSIFTKEARKLSGPCFIFTT